MRGKRSKMGLILMLMACVFLIDGCWGKREVEELAPLIGVGFDLGQKPGTILITGQYALPKKGGAKATDVEYWTISIEASSSRERNEKVSEILNRTAFMGSLKVMVIGEDVAKAGGFNDLLDFAHRFSEFRRTMYVVLAKGRAQDILNMKLRNGESPSMSIVSGIKHGDDTSSFPTVRLGHYLTVLSRISTAPIFPVVEIIKSGDEGIEYQAEGKDGTQELRLQGAGVFRGDHFVNYLTDEETKGYMWLENEVKYRMINTVGIDQSKINFGGRVTKSTTKYKVIDNNGTIELQYQIKADLVIDEARGMRKQFQPNEWLDLLKGAEQKFAKVIEKECELALHKERELGLDFLGIGRHIEKYKPAYWKTVKDQWEEKIANFPVSVNVEVTIHNAGMSSSSAFNSTGEGQE